MTIHHQSQCYSINRQKSAQPRVKILGKIKYKGKKKINTSRIIANKHQEIWDVLITQNKGCSDMTPCVLSDVPDLTRCPAACYTWRGEYASKIFYPLWRLFLFHCAIFPNQVLCLKNKKQKLQNSAFLPPAPLYITAYLKSKGILHFCSNTNIYLHSFKWGWIFWLIGFLFLFYKEKDMVAVKFCICRDKNTPSIYIVNILVKSRSKSFCVQLTCQTKTAKVY